MKNNKGFTLVELLAVIAILAILVIIAIPNVLKMFNDSKKNAFMVQARKTANVAQEHTVLSSDKTFDCNSLLTGQKFKDCTATVNKNNQVSVDVLGSGAYENFLMVDVTPNANSGTFVDLSKLNTIEVEKEFKKSLVKDNKINEPTFKQMTADEAVTFVSKLEKITPTEAEKQEFKDQYNNLLKNIKIENNLIKSTSKETPFAVTMTLTAGKYKLVYNVNDLILMGPGAPIIYNDNLINNAENIWNLKESDMFNYLYFTDYDIIRDDNNEIILTGTINISKDTKYYIFGDINENKTGPEITIEKISAFSINGKENITLMPEEVSSYKDAGVSYNGKTLTGNDVYTYTNLKDKEGEYKYNYIIKTNQGVKVLRRYIDVGKTSEKCFRFNKETQEIEQYYFVENNVSGGKKCPMNVVIPEKILGVQVKSIGRTAFLDHCGSILKTSSNNNYEIRKVVCYSEPIGINSVILPEGLEYIGDGAFYQNNLKTVTIPSTVTRIGWQAFADNQLQSVIFKGDKSKIEIGCEAFEGEKHSDSVNDLSELCDV